MSHFVGLCFGEYWESNLDAYDEGLEVEEYVVHTKDEAVDIVKQNRAKAYESASEYIRKSDITESSREYYQSVIDKGLFISYEDAWKEVQNWGYQIDEDENLISTYNPDSKWDWYSIGGRWSGFLCTKEKDDEGKPIRVNQALFKDIDWDYMLENDIVPFSFVTEEGEWYEKGQMGWWGITSNEMDRSTWIEDFQSYLKDIEDDCLVTVIDFHI